MKKFNLIVFCFVSCVNFALQSCEEIDMPAELIGEKIDTTNIVKPDVITPDTASQCTIKVDNITATSVRFTIGPAYELDHSTRILYKKKGQYTNSQYTGTYSSFSETGKGDKKYFSITVTGLDPSSVYDFYPSSYTTTWNFTTTYTAEYCAFDMNGKKLLLGGPSTMKTFTTLDN